MKLQGFSCALLFIIATGFVGAAHSVCVVRNAVWPIYFWYQCSGSTRDYVLDVKRAPLGLERISFTNSNIPTLKNSSFSRLGETVTVLVVSNSELVEIEDKAFQGLGGLVWIDLSANKLTVLKGAWFEEIPKMKYIDLKYNEISHVEGNFFTTLPNIKVLFLSNNQLNCLPVSSMSNFRAQQGIDLMNNPLSWRCRSELLDWESSNTYVTRGSGDLAITYNVTKNCIARSSTPDPDDEYINTCVETFLNDLLPTEDNYTLEKLCQFWASKPSTLDFKCTV